MQAFLHAKYSDEKEMLDDFSFRFCLKGANFTQFVNALYVLHTMQ